VTGEISTMAVSAMSVFILFVITLKAHSSFFTVLIIVVVVVVVVACGGRTTTFTKCGT